MSDTITVRFLGEERVFTFEKTDIFGDHYALTLNGETFELTHKDGPYPWGMWLVMRQKEGRLAKTPQEAAKVWEDLWRPLAKLLAPLGGDEP